MPHTSHSSYLSSKDENGHSVAMSINFQPYYKSKRREVSIYKGRARSNGEWRDDKHGEILLAKFFNSKSVVYTERQVAEEMQKLQIAQETAIKFNEVLRHQLDYMKRNAAQRNSCQHDLYALLQQNSSVTLRFETIQTAKLDTVSSFDRSRQKEESFIIMKKFDKFETFLYHSTATVSPPAPKDSLKLFRRFSKSSKSPGAMKNGRHSSSVGNLLQMDKDVCDYRRVRTVSEGEIILLDHCAQGTEALADNNNYTFCQNCRCWNINARKRIGNVQHLVLHAFFHYFATYHNNTMVIDKLRGVYDPVQGYVMSVPIIHTHNRRFSDQDGGLPVIRNALNDHVCSDLCSHLSVVNPLSGVLEDQPTPPCYQKCTSPGN